MSAKPSEPIRDEILAAVLDGEVTPSEARAVETELADSASVRRRLQGLRDVRAALSEPIDEVESLDLVDAVNRAIDAPELPQVRRWLHGRLRPWHAISAAVATVCLAILGTSSMRGPPSDDVRAKSNPADNQGRSQVDLQAYRVADGVSPVRVSDTVRARDGLAFSYTNVGSEPYEYLMIFGVEARGEVRWFYPAYEDENTSPNPESIKIEKGRVGMELHEAIHHEFAPGPLTLHALFSLRPLRVLDVEALVRAGHAAARFPVPPDCIDRTINIHVEP